MKTDITLVPYFYLLKYRGITMERKDAHGISTMIAILGMIELLIIEFAARFYLATLSSSSTGENNAWRAQRI